MVERDFEANPYTPDEQRVAAYLQTIAPDLGTGDDPVGFLIASHGQFVFERHTGSKMLSDPMSFGGALNALKHGAKVCRIGWNGKSMWISMSGPLKGREIAFENFWSANNAEYARQNGGSAVVLPCITMKTATGEILMGWLASQSDMLADDWMIVAD